MKSGSAIAIGLFASLVGYSVNASAHHSSAMFDRSQVVTLTGVIKKYDYTNPHSWLTIALTQEPSTTDEVLWGIEGYSPQSMSRLGLVPSKLPVGGKVTVKVHPLRDGRHGGTMIEITMPDGKVVNSAPQGEE